MGTEYVQKKNQAVEKLDCAVYAYAALNHLYQRYPRGKIWQIFTKRLLNNAKPAKNTPLKSRQESARKSYVNNW